MADRFLFPGKKLLSRVPPRAADPAALRRRHRHQAILGQYGALNALLVNSACSTPAHAVDWLGEGRFWGVVALNALHLYPDPLPQRHRRARQRRSRDGGSGGKPRLHRLPQVPQDHPAADHARPVCRRHHRLHLGLHRAGRAAHLRLSRASPRVQIFYGIKDIGGNPFPFALVAVMLVSHGAALRRRARLLFGRASHAMMAKATTAGGARTVGRGRAAGSAPRPSPASPSSPLLPHLGVDRSSPSRATGIGTVLPAAGRSSISDAALGHDLTVPSIVNSLKYASARHRRRPRPRHRHRLRRRPHEARRAASCSMPWRCCRSPCRGSSSPSATLAMTQDGRVLRLPESVEDPDAAPHHRLLRAPPALRGALRRPRDSSKPASRSRRPRRISAARRCATLRKHHPPAHHRQPHRRRPARLLLRHAGGVATRSSSRRSSSYYPITKAIYELFQLARRRPLHRVRARRLGDGVSRRHHLRHQPAAREKLGALFRV